MRLTCFCVVLALTAGFFADRTLAQIPERITFQPGSFAHGYQRAAAYPGVARTIVQPVAVAETEAIESADDEDADVPETEWEKTFGEKPEQPAESSQVPGQIAYVVTVSKPPYLAWHRNPWTGRIHLIPYQPGYAATPEQFPTHQSKLNLWLSTLPGREQNRPQQQYLGYYDPMPEILTDKPSRRQLLLGYGDPNWTASCANMTESVRAKTAYCPGVNPNFYGPPGPSAEAKVTDQPITDALGRPVPYPGAYGLFGFRRGIIPPPRLHHHPHHAHSCPHCPKPTPADTVVETPEVEEESPEVVMPEAAEE